MRFMNVGPGSCGPHRRPIHKSQGRELREWHLNSLQIMDRKLRSFPEEPAGFRH